MNTTNDDPQGRPERRVSWPAKALRTTPDHLLILNRQRHAHGQRRLHRCDTCGLASEWGPAWTWYGSLRDSDDGYVAKFCSPKCQRSTADAEQIIARKRHEHDAS